MGESLSTGLREERVEEGGDTGAAPHLTSGSCSKDKASYEVQCSVEKSGGPGAVGRR